MLKLYKNMLRPFERLNASIILFGSVASGKSRIDSDIDIAVVTNNKKVKEQARVIADKTLFDTGKVVSLVFFTEDEIKKRRDYPFEKDVLAGVVLNDKRGIVKKIMVKDVSLCKYQTSFPYIKQSILFSKIRFA